MGFPNQEYWSGLPFPFPGDLPNLVIKPMPPASPALNYLGSSIVAKNECALTGRFSTGRNILDNLLFRDFAI